MFNTNYTFAPGLSGTIINFPSFLFRSFHVLFFAKKSLQQKRFWKGGQTNGNVPDKKATNKKKMRLNIYLWLLLLLICGLKTISLCLACSKWTKKKTTRMKMNTHFSIWSFGKRLQLVTGQLKIISWFIVRTI